MIMTRKTELYATIFMYLYGKNNKLLFHLFKLFGPLPEKMKHIHMKVKKIT